MPCQSWIFPRVKPEAFETVGCRVGMPGFRVAVIAVLGRGRWGQLVICNGGMWGRLAGAGYSLSHSGKKKKEGQEEKDGLGGVGPLSQTFEDWTLCSSGLFSIPGNSRQGEASRGNTAERSPD